LPALPTAATERQIPAISELHREGASNYPRIGHFPKFALQRRRDEALGNMQRIRYLNEPHRRRAAKAFEHLAHNISFRIEINGRCSANQKSGSDAV
jgi:hypothetical protein